MADYEELKAPLVDAEWALQEACEFGFDAGYQRGFENGKRVGRSAGIFWIWAYPIFAILGFGVAWFLIVAAIHFGF